MTDREKVITHFRDAIEASGNGNKWRFVRVDILEEAIELLKEQPDVVQCKDCKYCEYPKSEKEWCKKGHLHGKAEIWFCADGERKENK